MLGAEAQDRSGIVWVGLGTILDGQGEGVELGTALSMYVTVQQ